MALFFIIKLLINALILVLVACCGINNWMTTLAIVVLSCSIIFDVVLALGFAAASKTDNPVPNEHN